MAQEFLIKSTQLEDKINQLLPSQGGQGAGVDLSATTQIVPIVDLTESAEGSSLRADLQSALGFTVCTSFSINNTTTTVVNTTGYWRVIGTATSFTTASPEASWIINDGTTDKTIYTLTDVNAAAEFYAVSYDFIVFLAAGDSLKGKTTSRQFLAGSVRQLADLQGNLVNPS